MDIIKLRVDENFLERLDLYISNEIEDISRTKIQKLIKSNNVLVNNKKEKMSYLVKENDLIEVKIPEEKSLEIVAEDIPLEIIYEDKYLAVINKPKGMVVHPSPGHRSGTLVNALLYKMQTLSDINGEIRPGIVHRLDKDTSGLLIIAKDNVTHEILASDLKERKIRRFYKCLVHGVVSNKEGMVDAPIGRNPVNRQKMAVVYENSRRAVTYYKVLEHFDNYTYLEIELETGRTHQIRVHMNHINYPIVGDQVYSSGKNPFGLKEQFLHSVKLIFDHPISNKEMKFEIEIPDENKKILDTLLRRRENLWN